jgi:2-keto-4-pentenoate hydratase/2-oxohepta-3-ene-1,7-dioic acid hydratase in catechol pathway
MTDELPDTDEEIVYEGEIGVVIDEECRNVSESNASEYIRGYTCVNDITNFDRGEHDLVRAKAFDYAAPIGPAVAPPSMIPDDATLELRLNGERKQQTSMAELLFPIEELIADVSSFMTLEPGDVISSGTPAGVGPLADGDTVEVEVEGVGTLEHDVKR